MINTTPLSTPFFGMMILTFLVWIYMYIRRLSWIANNKPDPVTLSTPEKLAQTLPEHINYASYNLKNLFELPVLFYAVCLYLMCTDVVDEVHIICAYVFLSFRILHSLIHCTINFVPARFVTYLIASIALWTMIVRSFIQVI